eukprot:127369_1
MDRTSPQPPNMSRYRFIDATVTIWLMIFTVVAFVFEPVLVFLCKGDLDACVNESHPNNILVKLWMVYTQFDPLFIHTPFWLVIMCGIDCCIFGPMYAVILYGWIYYSYSNWFKNIVLIWNGALVYSTIVYFVYEMIIEYHRISVTAVVLINIPWTIIPIVLLIRVLHPNYLETRKKCK